jgi:hypothetical protein
MPAMRRRIFSVAVLCGLLGVAARAHHSIAAIYDGSQRTTIEGVIAQVRFVNPHPYIVADVKEAGGTIEPWRLEMDNRSELAAIGFTHDTLAPGDRIVVTGSPARSQPRSLYVRRLDRDSDGFWYEQVGERPRMRQRSDAERHYFRSRAPALSASAGSVARLMIVVMRPKTAIEADVW